MTYNNQCDLDCNDQVFSRDMVRITILLRLASRDIRRSRCVIPSALARTAATAVRRQQTSTNSTQRRDVTTSSVKTIAKRLKIKIEIIVSFI